jgi:hypothetical protein
MENTAALAETVRTSMERHHVPGVAVGLYDGKKSTPAVTWWAARETASSFE